MNAGVACCVDFSAAAGSETGKRVSAGFTGPREYEGAAGGERIRSCAAMAVVSSAGSRVTVGSGSVFVGWDGDSSDGIGEEIWGGGGGMVGRIRGGFMEEGDSRW